mmetsp:Transcript_80784/g.250827  ORF Transcript_80784/g.250827 Transcript_80784/m.250827 type:complete len:368 (-) Transcript_80784:134-1237(-)
MPRRAAARKVARPAVSTLRAAVACDQELEQALEASRRSARARQLEDEELARALELSEASQRYERELTRALELSRQAQRREALEAEALALAAGPPTAEHGEGSQSGRLVRAAQHEAMARILIQPTEAEAAPACAAAAAASFLPLGGAAGRVHGEACLGDAGLAAADSDTELAVAVPVSVASAAEAEQCRALKGVQAYSEAFPGAVGLAAADADAELAEAVRASLASVAEAEQLRALEGEAMARAAALSMAAAREDWGRQGFAAEAAAGPSGPSEFDLAEGELAAGVAAMASMAASSGAATGQQGEEGGHDGLQGWWFDEDAHLEEQPGPAEGPGRSGCSGGGAAAADAQSQEEGDEWLLVEEPAAPSP